jgi:hypothetical protein
MRVGINHWKQALSQQEHELAIERAGIELLLVYVPGGSVSCN